MRVGKGANSYAFSKSVAGNEVNFCAVFLKESIHFFRERIRNNIAARTDKFHLAEVTFEIACLVNLFKEIGHAENKADFVFFDSV